MANLLTIPQATFETLPTGWTVTSGSMGRSATYKNQGTYSGMLDALGTTPEFVTGDMPVTAGQTYSASIYGYQPSISTVTITCHIVWRNAANATISTSSGTAVGKSNGAAWSRMSVSAVAPAGAVNARMRVTATSSNSTLRSYFDMAQFELGSLSTWTTPVAAPTRPDIRVRRNNGTWVDVDTYAGTDIRIRTNTGWTSLKTPTKTEIRVRRPNGTWADLI